MNSNNYRARLLNGASVAVIASSLGVAMSLGLGSTARAAITATAALQLNGATANTLFGVSSSGVANETNQFQNGLVSVPLSGDVHHIDVGSSDGPAAVTGTGTSAIAVGNQDPANSPINSLSYSLGSIGPGSAESINQVVAPTIPADAGDAKVVSTVTSSKTYVAISTGLSDGTVMVGGANYGSGNTISALTILNSATTNYSGSISTGFSSGTTGGFALNYNPATVPPTTVLSSQGSVDLLTSQYSSLAEAGAGSNATVTTDLIYATPDYGTTAATTLSGSIGVEGNTISATYQGNNVDGGIFATSGGASTFTGSMTLGTLQVNSTDATLVSPLAARNDGSQVFATVYSSTGTDTLTGSLAITGNTISASATGNNADTPHYDSVTGSLDSTGGNVISLGAGLSFQGSGSLLADKVEFPGGGVLTSTVSGDITLGNVQANLGASLSASTTTGSVFAYAQDMSAGLGSVQVGNNAITSSVAGNKAYNLVTGGSATDNFSGTIGVQNVQTNEQTTVGDVTTPATFTSTVSGSSVTAEVGTIDLGGGGVSGVTIEVGSKTAGLGNTIASSAVGNSAGTFVDLTYNSITNAALINGYATGISIQGDRASNSVAVQNGDAAQNENTALPFFPPGAVIINVQSNLTGSAVTSVNSGSTVGLTAGDTSTVSSSTLGVDNNSITSVAVGNSSNAGFDLTTAALQGNAGIGSVQTQSGIVSSSLTGGVVALTVVPNFDTATATIDNNTLSSIAQGNFASNNITLTTGSYGNFNGGGAWQRVVTSSPTPFDSSSASDAYAYGGLTLLNEQLVTTGISATTDTGAVTLTFHGALGVGGPAAADNSGNTIETRAQGNIAINGVTLTSSTGGTFAGEPSANGSSLGVITNLQSVSAPSIVASSTTSALGSGGISTIIDGATLNATVTMNSNTVSALATGNVAENTVAATGANAIDWNSPVDYQSIQFQGLSIVQIYGLNIVNNGQFTGTGTISANVGGIVIADLGTNTLSPTTGSTVTVNGTSFIASAYDNLATNSVQTSATDSLGATAAVFSNQISFANTTATAGTSVTPTLGALAAYDVTNSALTVSNGSTFATAYANSATNSLGAASGNEAFSNTSASTVQGVQWLSGYGNIGVPDGIAGDYVVGNVQQLTGNVSASTFGASGMGVFNTGDTSGVNNVLTVSGNVSQADARGNYATNSASLSIWNGSSSGAPSVAVGSVQVAAGAGTGTLAQTVTATSQHWFGVLNVGTLASSTISVSGNASNAIAMVNTAFNSLTVSSGNSLGSDYGAGVGSATTTSALNPSLVSTTSVADYAVSNTQTSADANVSASASAGSPFAIGGINAEFSALDAVALTVSGNQAYAEAGANTATNGLTLTAANILGATASVLNYQISNSNVSASAGGNLGMYVAYFDGSVTASTLQVKGNSLVASAWGNSATNTVTVTAGNGFGVYKPTVLTVPGPGAATGTNIVNAGTAVLNEQTNSGAISATASNSRIQVFTGYGSVLNSPIAVTGNAIQAFATGNNVTNSVTLNGNNGSGAIGNGQQNSGNVTATASGNFIGIYADGVGGSGTVSGGALNVSGNTISATAIGNSATNNLVLNGNSATGGVSSTQVNTGNETATITGATIGITSTGAVGGPMVVSGNQIVAMAVGNASTTTTHH